MPPNSRIGSAGVGQPENLGRLAAILETGAAKQTLIMAADPDPSVA